MVSNKHKMFLKFSRQIQKVRDVLDGDTALRSEKYIPALPKQNYKEYFAYINRPPFANFTDKLLDNLTGLAFAKDPTKDVTPKLEKLLMDIDLNDSSDIDIAQEAVNEVLISSRVGILVDYTSSGILESVNGAIADNFFRPYAKIYKNESIINWTVTNNQLTKVVLMEEVEIQISEFQTDDQIQYLVLDLFEGKYRVRRFVEDREVDIIIDERFPTQNGKYMTYIPFFVANPSKLSLDPTKPPLYNMADLNLSHFKLNVELYHGLFFVGMPTAYGSGIDDESTVITLGASEVHLFNNPNAKLQFLEFTGQGLTAIENKIKETENNMGAIGAEFLKEKTASQISTTTMAMQTAGDRASLISVVNTVSRMMTLVLKEMALWLSENPEKISYSINNDFILTRLDPQMLKTYGDLNVAGVLTDYDLWYKLKQTEEIDTTLTFQEWTEYRQNSQSAMMLQTTTEPTQTAQEDSSFRSTLRSVLGLKG